MTGRDGARVDEVSVEVGASPDASTDGALLVEGRVVGGRYRVEALLGQGGFAEVYRARHEEIRTLQVAIKVMRRRGEDGRFDVESFRREAETLARLRSPYVVPVTDFGTLRDGRPYLVMEWVKGRTLAEVLEARGRLPAATVAELGQQLLAGLDAAHGAGVLHLDLKPGNLAWEDEDGGVRCRVLDFGIARTFDVTEGVLSVPASDGRVRCTPAWAAPEVFEDRPGPASDLFSAAMVLASALDGLESVPTDRAFPELLRERMGPEPWRLGERASSSPMASVLRRALRAHPDARWDSARAMASALADAMRTGPPLVGDATVQVRGGAVAGVETDRGESGPEPEPEQGAGCGAAAGSTVVYDEPLSGEGLGAGEGLVVGRLDDGVRLTESEALDGGARTAPWSPGGVAVGDRSVGERWRTTTPSRAVKPKGGAKRRWLPLAGLVLVGLGAVGLSWMAQGVRDASSPAEGGVVDGVSEPGGQEGADVPVGADGGVLAATAVGEASARVREWHRVRGGGAARLSCGAGGEACTVTAELLEPGSNGIARSRVLGLLPLEGFGLPLSRPVTLRFSHPDGRAAVRTYTTAGPVVEEAFRFAESPDRAPAGGRERRVRPAPEPEFMGTIPRVR